MSDDVVAGAALSPYINYDGGDFITYGTTKKVYQSSNKGDTWKFLFDMPTPDANLKIAIPKYNIYVVQLDDDTGYTGIDNLVTTDGGDTWAELDLDQFSGDYTNVEDYFHMQQKSFYVDYENGDFAALINGGGTVNQKAGFWTYTNVSGDIFTVPEIPRLTSMRWNEFYWVKAG